MALGRQIFSLEGKEWPQRETVFEGAKSELIGKIDRGQVHYFPYSTQNPDYSDNSKTGSFGNLERHDFNVYNGVLTMGTVNNVCGFPWRLMAKDNGQVRAGNKEQDRRHRTCAATDIPVLVSCPSSFWRL